MKLKIHDTFWDEIPCTLLTLNSYQLIYSFNFLHKFRQNKWPFIGLQPKIAWIEKRPDGNTWIHLTSHYFQATWQTEILAILTNLIGKESFLDIECCIQFCPLEPWTAAFFFFSFKDVSFGWIHLGLNSLSYFLKTAHCQNKAPMFSSTEPRCAVGLAL